VAVTAAVPLPEAGTGVDAASLSAAIALTESGLGIDGFLLGRLLDLLDTGTAAELLSAASGRDATMRVLSGPAGARLGLGGLTARTLTLGEPRSDP
jgi:hypothetical protein